MIKTRYQYTYYIYPFYMEKKEYKKYVKELLKDKNFKLKLFQREIDTEFYAYFTKDVKENIFTTFELSKKELNKLEKNRRKLLKLPFINFEYNIETAIQGKIGDSGENFFEIPKIEILCFDTGHCFLCIKTNIQYMNDFQDVADFNYEFVSYTDRINIQKDTYKDTKTFIELVKDLTKQEFKKRKFFDI